jgi:hypothetical protein
MSNSHSTIGSISSAKGPGSTSQDLRRVLRSQVHTTAAVPAFLATSTRSLRYEYEVLVIQAPGRLHPAAATASEREQACRSGQQGAFHTDRPEERSAARRHGISVHCQICRQLLGASAVAAGRQRSAERRPAAVSTALDANAPLQ